MSRRVRVAAINFLNPAPLMWDFEHPPRARSLRARYELRYMQPSSCAAELLDGRSDLGLVPVAALAPPLLVVPGCAIASRGTVRSILLLVGQGRELKEIRTVAADTASLSSVAYTRVLFRRFLGTDPEFIPMAADPVAMLARADAGLVIGDPALHAHQQRQHIEAAAGPCRWVDLAEEWIARTGLPWVAAVWALRGNCLATRGCRADDLVGDLQRSRDHGLTHREELVDEWAPRLGLPPEVVSTYLTENIHYLLGAEEIEAIERFRGYAAEIGALPPLLALRLLG